MSLNFVDLIKRFVFRPQPDLDSAGSISLANTGNHRLTTGCDHKLRNHGWKIIGHHLLLPLLQDSVARNHLVTADSQNFVLFSRHIYNRREFDLLLVVVLLGVTSTDSFRVLLVRVEVVEINVTALAASSETEIVLEPVDATDLLDMTNEHHSGWAITGVEVVNVNVLLVGDASKLLTTMGELDFSAGLDRV